MKILFMIMYNQLKIHDNAYLNVQDHKKNLIKKMAIYSIKLYVNGKKLNIYIYSMHFWTKKHIKYI